MNHYSSSTVEEKCLQKIPDSYLEQINGYKNKCSNEKEDKKLSKECMKSFLLSRLPSNDVNEIDRGCNKRYNFTAVQAIFKKRVKRKGCPRNTGLSSTKKRELGFYKTMKKELIYEQCLPMHECWKEYIAKVIDLSHIEQNRWEGEISSTIHEDFSQKLWKADLHYALISVMKSTNPPLVGIEGLVVLETRNVFKLLGKDNIMRIIPKVSCEFKLKVGKYEIHFLGKHYMVPPTERINKKVKAGKFLNL